MIVFGWASVLFDVNQFPIDNDSLIIDFDPLFPFEGLFFLDLGLEILATIFNFLETAHGGAHFVRLFYLGFWFNPLNLRQLFVFHHPQMLRV